MPNQLSSLSGVFPLILDKYKVRAIYNIQGTLLLSSRVRFVVWLARRLRNMFLSEVLVDSVYSVLPRRNRAQTPIDGGRLVFQE